MEARYLFSILTMILSSRPAAYGMAINWLEDVLALMNAFSSSCRLEKPNFLVLLVDEERYPPVYENAEIQHWRNQNLMTQQLLRSHALEFHRHYIGSAACCPSRATLFTGHYPSLHGVSQTNGIAKQAFDSDMFWLDPNTVPTMGDYFRAAGYQTYYKGKWHISNGDIVIPGTHTSLASYNWLTGLLQIKDFTASSIISFRKMPIVKCTKLSKRLLTLLSMIIQLSSSLPIMAITSNYKADLAKPALLSGVISLRFFVKRIRYLSPMSPFIS